MLHLLAVGLACFPMAQWPEKAEVLSLDYTLWKGIQASLGAIVGEFPGHQSKANIAINRVLWILPFPGAYKKLCLYFTVVYEV